MKKISAAILMFSLVFLYSCTDSKSPSSSSSTTGADFVMSFQNGLLPYTQYNGCMDTMLVEYDPTASYYSSANIISGQIIQGKIRALIKFDLTPVDPNSVQVKAAYLKLTNYYGSGSFKACKVTSAWNSGATWNTYNSITSWALPGGDFTETADSGWVSVTAANGNEELILKLNNDMVESWINDSHTNYGVIIISRNENTTGYQEADFLSSDDANITLRPKLTIYYSL